MKQLVMATLAVILSFAAYAQNKVNLPAPRKDADMTLYQALQQSCYEPGFCAAYCGTDSCSCGY